MTFNFTRGHPSPLTTLTCNFSPAKPRAHDADKLRVTMLSLYRSLAIISRVCVNLFCSGRAVFRVYTESISSVPFWKIWWTGCRYLNRGLVAVSKKVLRIFRTSFYCKFLLESIWGFFSVYRFCCIVIGRVKVTYKSIYLFSKTAKMLIYVKTEYVFHFRKKAWWRRRQTYQTTGNFFSLYSSWLVDSEEWICVAWKN